MGNMFRCTLASGGALVLTVTCDSVFAGQTITCTDGTTTLTQTCPSTSPYTVEFRIPNGGTWTISSGTGSTSVVIPDAIELHSIPNGSTITPTDDIQIWLHCANIWDKAYTTLSEVLNDSSTLQALIAFNNAVDYMVRSTTWATDVCINSTAMSLVGLDDYCAETLLGNSTWNTAICNSTYFQSVLNMKIPTMTSDTDPSGVASGYNTYPGEDAYKAFEGTNISWQSKDNSYNNSWVQYKFPSTKLIPQKLALRGAGQRNLICNIQGSSDGTTFENIKTGITVDNQATDKYFNVDNLENKSYLYFRLVPTQYNNTNNNRVMVSVFQVFGRAAS